MQNHKRPPASLLFIFGGSGDLNYRKLSPALFNLFIDDWMPEKFDIVGIGRTEYAGNSYHEHLLDGISQFSRRKGEQNGKWADFSKHVAYLQMDAEVEEEYQKIAEVVKAKEKEYSVRRRLQWSGQASWVERSSVPRVFSRSSCLNRVTGRVLQF